MIDRDIYGPALEADESRELAALQELADKFLSWKDAGAMQNSIRRLKRHLAKIEHNSGSDQW